MARAGAGISTASSPAPTARRSPSRSTAQFTWPCATTGTTCSARTNYSSQAHLDSRALSELAPCAASGSRRSSISFGGALRVMLSDAARGVAPPEHVACAVVDRGELERGGADVGADAVVDGIVGRVVVDDEVVVEGVALRRERGRRSGSAEMQLETVGAVLGAGGGDDVLLEHHRAEVVSAHVQGELAGGLAGGQPGALQVLDVVEVQPGDGDQAQVLVDRRVSDIAEVVVLRLVGPRDERAEARRCGPARRGSSAGARCAPRRSRRCPS